MNLFKLRRPAVAVVEPVPAAPAAAASLSSEWLMASAALPAPIFVRGQGSWLWDNDGRVYLDFTQGSAGNSLGHCPQVVSEALSAQAQTLLNCGGQLTNHNQLLLAQKLCQSTGSDQAYLLNSGAEACAAAIRLARKWGQLHRSGADHVITASQACHGRGLDTSGFSQVAFNDLSALHAAVDSRTVAIMLEPIQGEAGVIPASREYLQGVERLCRELGILLIFDEALTGIGRCGALLAEQRYDVRADIIALGTGLGGGVPVAALLARGSACCAEPGELQGSQHGNALMCAAGLAVLQSVLAPGFFEQIKDRGRHLREGLSRLSGRYGHGEVRGQGLLWALQLHDEVAPALVQAALQEGLLLQAPQPDVVRFAPALTISRGLVDEMLLKLARAFARLHGQQYNRREMRA